MRKLMAALTALVMLLAASGCGGSGTLSSPSNGEPVVISVASEYGADSLGVSIYPKGVFTLYVDGKTIGQTDPAILAANAPKHVLTVTVDLAPGNHTLALSAVYPPTPWPAPNGPYTTAPATLTVNPPGTLKSGTISLGQTVQVTAPLDGSTTSNTYTLIVS